MIEVKSFSRSQHVFYTFESSGSYIRVKNSRIQNQAIFQKFHEVAYVTRKNFLANKINLSKTICAKRN